MAKKFYELYSNMKPESQLRSQAMTEELLRQRPLYKLKRARELSQQMLAQVLNVKKPSITELEKFADMYLSTLRTQIQAMGGELKIVVRFPHGTVSVSSFSKLDNEIESGALNIF